MNDKQCEHIWVLESATPPRRTESIQEPQHPYIYNGKNIYFCQKCLERKTIIIPYE